MEVWVVEDGSGPGTVAAPAALGPVRRLTPITFHDIDKWSDTKLWAVMSLRTRAMDWLKPPGAGALSTPARLATYLSHVQAWRRVAEDMPHAVLLMDASAQLLCSAKDLDSVWHPDTPVLWLRQGVRGAAVTENATGPLTHYGGCAYVLTPKGARLLLAEALPAALTVPAYIGAVGAKHSGTVRVTSQVFVGGGGLGDLSRFLEPGAVRMLTLAGALLFVAVCVGVLLGQRKSQNSSYSVVSAAF